MSENLTFYTDRLLLRILQESSAAAVLDYYRRNRAFHQNWFAYRSDEVFTLKQQKINLAAEYSEFRAGRAVPFWLSLQSEPGKIIGRFAFTQIVRGCFDSCFVAYHLDQNYQGQGLAYEAGQAAIPIMFNDFGLHRLEANIMPANRRSIALAEKLGFKLEGLSRRYLKINGDWEDHLHYVILSDEPGDEPDAPEIKTGYLHLRTLKTKDIPAAIDYYQRNREHLGKWNPALSEDLSSTVSWQRILARTRRDQADGRRLDYGIFLSDRPDRLVGIVECRSISPLPLASCEIGFSMDQMMSGRGLMLNALSEVISYLFARYGLQRITAKCCTDHARSIRLLELLGFAREGMERRSIYLHDHWQDMICLALLREDYHPVEEPEI